MTTLEQTDPARIARTFQALSDETRLQIVALLATGEHCVCDLQTALEAYQSRLSFHLRKLKDAGLVRDRREGRWVYYSLDTEALDELTEHLDLLRSAAQASPQVKCCG